MHHIHGFELSQKTLSMLDVFDRILVRVVCQSVETVSGMEEVVQEELLVLD